MHIVITWGSYWGYTELIVPLWRIYAPLSKVDMGSDNDLLPDDAIAFTLINVNLWTQAIIQCQTTKKTDLWEYASVTEPLHVKLGCHCLDSDQVLISLMNYFSQFESNGHFLLLSKWLKYDLVTRVNTVATKLPPFSTRHFQTYIFKWKCLNLKFDNKLAFVKIMS